MPRTEKKISVIIPAHQEGHHIFKNLLEIAETIKNFTPKYELVIVDDGSTDDTFDEAQKAQTRLGPEIIKLIRSETNHGKGFALKTAFEHSSGDYILFLDADLDIHPRQIDNFLEIIQRTDADVVISSKRHPDSKISYPLKRKILSDLYFLMTWFLFGLPVKDTQTGLALFKRVVLEKVFPKIVVKQYAFSLEILVLAHKFGYKIQEAPVVIDFKTDFSHIGYRDIRNIFMDTLGVFYRLKIIRYYGSLAATGGERKKIDTPAKKGKN